MPTPFNAFNPNTPNLIAFDAAILYVGASPLGITRGGTKYDPKITFRNIPFDGARTPYAGLDRRTKVEAEISGKFLQMDLTSFLNIETGGVSSGSGSGTILNSIIVQPFGQLIPVGSLLGNFSMVGHIGSGQFVRVRFYRAAVVKYAIATADNNEWEIDATFQARGDLTIPGMTTDSPPYTWETLSTPSGS